jgi:hypothetical protein
MLNVSCCTFYAVRFMLSVATSYCHAERHYAECVGPGFKSFHLQDTFD